MTKEQVIARLEDLALYHRKQRDSWTGTNKGFDQKTAIAEASYQNGQYVALQEAVRIIQFEME